MVDSEIVEGQVMEGLLAELLSRPDVAFVHARNARAGCYACAIIPRSGATGPASNPRA